MNKNHLLPALLFVLAACGGTASSTPASSIALDTNEYRMIGGQANIGGWSETNGTIMTRTAGTNSYSWTGDLYEDSTWKIIVGTAWVNGQVNPASAGLTVTDKGVAWTKDAQGALVIPEDGNTTSVPDGFDGFNFQTLVDGSYTVTLVSLPALSRTLTIVRNGDPVIPAPSITDWSLVGTMIGWTVEDLSFKMSNLNDENEYYSLTLNLYVNDEFKFAKNGAWGGDLGFSIVQNPVAGDIVENGGNIKVLRAGSYEITLTVGASASATTATVVRVGDLARLAGGLFLVGDVTTPAWTPSDTSLSLADTNGDGKYYGVFTLGLNKEFKLKSGTEWGVGFDAGFDRVASMPTGAFENAGAGNIKVLVGTEQVPHAFLIEARIVGSSLRIVISPAWSNYGFPTLAYAPTTGTSIGYLNTTDAFWNANAQLRIYGGFDATKTKVNFEYTGVNGHQYVFKIEQQGGVNKEVRSVATGEKQTFVLDISSISEVDRAKLNLLVVFHELPNNGTVAAPVSGTLVIHGVSYAS